MSLTNKDLSPTPPPQTAKKVCTLCKDPERELYNSSWCTTCKNLKEKERRSNLSADKKEEMRKKERERYEKNKLKAKQLIKEIDLTSKLTCTKCKKTKKLDEFYIAKQKGNIRAKCKICSLKDKKEYYDKNKIEYNKKTSEYKKQKEKSDPAFLFERRLRCRIYHAFKSQSLKKTNKTQKYLGCSGKFLHDWLSYQFTEDMTIENYGSYWHIDHVKPCASYDLSDENQAMECFNWQNLRPLKCSDNLEKSDTIDEKLIKIHQKKVDEYLKTHQLEI